MRNNNNRFAKVKITKKEGFLPVILKEKNVDFVDVKRIFTGSEIVYKLKNYQYGLLNGSLFLKQEEVFDPDRDKLLKNKK